MRDCKVFSVLQQIGTKLIQLQPFPEVAELCGSTYKETKPFCWCIYKNNLEGRGEV